MQYKAIIFDFFGVISSEVAPFWFARHFSKDQITELKEKYVYPADNGEITDNELFHNLANITSMSPDKVRQDWFDLVHINSDLIAYIKALKSNYSIALCSNAPSAFIRTILEDNYINSLFDVIIISSEIKAAKPNKTIFENTLSELRLEASEVIFIDDNPKYVLGAKSIGIQSLLFTNTSELIKSLKALAVL